jgi:hypothetical protein
VSTLMEIHHSLDSWDTRFVCSAYVPVHSSGATSRKARIGCLVGKALHEESRASQLQECNSIPADLQGHEAPIFLARKRCKRSL